MKFASVEALIQSCEEHLANTGTQSTDIESYFVHYILIRICAEYEARIAALVHKRCSRSRDSHLKAFTRDAVKRACRYFEISDISGLLGKFGGNYKNSFQSVVMQGNAHIAWNNIYSNRHAVAHKAIPQVTLRALKQDYADSLGVFDALAAALQLRTREMRDFT